MSQDDRGWKDYYQKIKGRAPRQLVHDVLEYFPENMDPSQMLAIDLGCGDGTETVLLLARGWQVLAVDGEPDAMRHLMEKVSPGTVSRLQVQVARFKDVELPAAELIHASLSLPFCEPEYFDDLWSRITAAIKPGGRFAGQFFGVRDSWSGATDMTFHTGDQVRSLFGEFEIEDFQELEEDGNSASGPKHWHVFTVIARKQ